LTNRFTHRIALGLYTLRLINIPDIFDGNLKKDYKILTFFDTNILDTTASWPSNDRTYLISFF